MTKIFYVVYRALATGTWSRRIMHWQSLWLAGMAQHLAAGAGACRPRACS